VIIVSAEGYFQAEEPLVILVVFCGGTIALSLFTGLLIYQLVEFSIEARDIAKKLWRKNTPHRKYDSSNSRYRSLKIDLATAHRRLRKFLYLGLSIYLIGALSSIFLAFKQPDIVEQWVQNHLLQTLEVLTSLLLLIPNSVVALLLPSTVPANSTYDVIALLLMVVLPSIPFSFCFANFTGIYTRKLTDVYLSLYWMLSGESSVSESQTREVKLNLVYDGVTIFLLFLLIFVELGF
jgi:hypothetical protein